MLTVYRRCSSDREKKYGESAAMVWQGTVNPPTSVTTGSIPVFSTKFSGIHITVIISDCLSEDGSSTLPCRAKFCGSGGMVYTLVLEASAERIKSSSLFSRTKFC